MNGKVNAKKRKWQELNMKLQIKKINRKLII